MYNDLAVIDFTNVAKPVVRRLTFDAGWFNTEWKSEGTVAAARTPAGLGLNPRSTGAFEFAAPLFQRKPVSGKRAREPIRYIATYNNLVDLVQMPGHKAIDMGLHQTTLTNFLKAQRLGRQTAGLLSRSDEQTGLTLCSISNSATAGVEGYATAALTIDSRSAKLIGVKYFEGGLYVREWRNGLLQLWQSESHGIRLWVLSASSQEYEMIGFVSGSPSSPDWTPHSVSR
jgi:hypothetical protein